MIKSILTAAALATGLGFAAAPAATAAPLVQPAAPIEAGQGIAENVHYRGGRRHYHRGHRGRRIYRGHRRPRVNLGVQLNFGPRYGYAPRYRSYRAAPVYRGYSARHHAWCAGRYRSYSRASGTFQPYHGPRRRCNSPYDGI